MSDPILDKNYLLKVTSSGEELRQDDQPWHSIFNSEKFFALHTQDRRGYYFRYRNAATNELVAVAHYAETAPGVFVSPARGTFGGYESAASEIPMLERFVSDVENYLFQAGARSLMVTLKPLCHDGSGGSNLYNLLARAGYRATGYDLSYVLPTKPGELIERMQRNNQKKMRKCEREGFVFNICTTPADCLAAYEAVAVNRTTKGIPLTMSYEQLMVMHDMFPGKMHFFNVTHAQKIIAGSICLAITSEVFYIFYWGDLPGYETYSPVVLLASGIHDFAREQGFALVDAGTSTVGNVPNHGLIRFKEKLGFEASLKFVFQKELTHA